MSPISASLRIVRSPYARVPGEASRKLSESSHKFRYVIQNPDAVAKRLASAAPDARGVVALAAIEDTLSADGAWDGYAALERQIAWLQARQAKLLARAETAVIQPDRPDGRDWAEAELAP